MKRTNKKIAIIIGAGPAGLTAGLYTARAGKKTIILEGRAASRLSIGYELENYPGFISIDSRELHAKFREHAEHFGAEIMTGDVIDFNLSFDPKMVTTRDVLFQAKTVILATGKPLPKGKMIPGEEKHIGLGVSYCSTCDGPLFSDRRVLAVGNSEEVEEDILVLEDPPAYLVQQRSMDIGDSWHAFIGGTINDSLVVYTGHAEVVDTATVETSLGTFTSFAVTYTDISSGEVETCFWTEDVGV